MHDVFILGAGFSKALNGKMPTMNELGGDVVKLLEDMADVERSAIYIPPAMYNFGTNVEYWITYLSQAQPWLREEVYQSNLSLAGSIRRAIRDVIDRRTRSSKEDLPPSWADDLVCQWHRNRANVITLNYDTLVESICLRTVDSEGASRIVIELDQIYPRYLANVLSRTGRSMSGGSNLPSFSYLKLHGSTNWFYSGVSNFYGETIYYSDVRSWIKQYAGQQSVRPPWARDKEYLIIPPVTDKLTYFNNETIRSLWQEAGNALWSARRIFVIGYSLPESDLGMRFFLQSQQPDDRVPVYIVDVDVDVVDRYRQLLPDQNVIGNFSGSQSAVEAFADQYISS